MAWHHNSIAAAALANIKASPPRYRPQRLAGDGWIEAARYWGGDLNVKALAHVRAAWMLLQPPVDANTSEADMKAHLAIPSVVDVIDEALGRVKEEA